MAEVRWPMARIHCLVTLVTIAASVTPRTSVGEPSVKDVVRRMSAYVGAYGGKTSIVVATERYEQSAASTGGDTEHRTLVADFAIVKVEGMNGWMGYRDVIEVDGTRVTDREDRLIQVLTSSSGTPDEARRLADESARFNIGPVLRTFNVPTAALFFFAPGTVDRFKFTPHGAGEPWELAFREKERPTLIRTPDGRSLPSAGSVWVNSEDGAIVRTRLRLTGFSPPSFHPAHDSAVIDVTYRRVDELGMWLPATMTEMYEGTLGSAWDRITSRAEYSNYRRFQTRVRIK